MLRHIWWVLKGMFVWIGIPDPQTFLLQGESFPLHYWRDLEEFYNCSEFLQGQKRSVLDKYIPDSRVVHAVRLRLRFISHNIVDCIGFSVVVTIALCKHLGPICTKRQRQGCNDACNSVLIKNNGVTPEWDCNLFSSDSTDFNENKITSVIIELLQPWRWHLV